MGGGAVEPGFGAVKPLGVDQSQHQVGVGHGWHRAAASVAGRARVGAGAARADAGQSARVGGDDAPAAGADRDDVDRGELQVVTVDAALDAGQGRTIYKQADVAAGAPHVERDAVTMPETRGHGDAGAGCAGGPRIEHVDRSPSGLGDRARAGTDLLDRAHAGKSTLGDGRLQRVEIGDDGRPQIRVEDRCAGPFEIADLAR